MSAVLGMFCVVLKLDRTIRCLGTPIVRHEYAEHTDRPCNSLQMARMCDRKM